jgi:hypothetical protein
MAGTYSITAGVVAEDVRDGASKNWVRLEYTFEGLALIKNTIDNDRYPDKLYTIVLCLGYVDGAEEVWCRRVL